MHERDGINPAAKPSGTGCVECLARGGWWLHLRRCAECGHIGCCDSSPSQHASKHHAAMGHPIITSFEPGEHWFYDYRTEEFITGPKLQAPHSTSAGTGRSGAFKLANAASRIRGRFFGAAASDVVRSQRHKGPRVRIRPLIDTAVAASAWSTGGFAV